MDDWLTKEEIQKKYKHVSEHAMPFECNIVDVIPQAGTDFSERWTFLKSLFYITDDGYYFQYSDVVPNSVNVKQEGDPFDVYLDGALRCAYPYAYTSSPGVTTGFINLILSKGKVYVNRNRNNKLHFNFVGAGWTYIRNSSSNNNVKEKEKASIEYITVSTTAKYFKDIYLLPLKLGNRNLCLTPHHIDPYNKLCFYDEIKYNRYNENNRLSLGQSAQIFAKLQGKYRFINPNTFEPLPYRVYFTNYRSSLDKDKNILWIEVNDKWGLYDCNNNKYIIPPRLDDFGFCSETFVGNIVMATYNGKYGVLDESGIVILHCIYDSIQIKTPTRYRVKQGDNEWEIVINKV